MNPPNTMAPAGGGLAHGIPRSRRGFLIIAVLWSALVAASMAWNLWQDRSRTMAEAYAEVRANFGKDNAVQRWTASHGGVYVAVTEDQAPVEWLANVAGRDAVTTDGRALTLLNPSALLRQLDGTEQRGAAWRITALKYINPANAPDPWERSQLEAFERGDRTDGWTIGELGGRPYLRYLRVMHHEPACDRCHAAFGFQSGEVRGATGINLPLEPYYAHIADGGATLSTSHAVIWLVGLLGLFVAQRRQGEHEAHARAAYQTLADSEARHRLIVESAAQGFWMIDADRLTLEVNSALCEMLGYTREEMLGRAPTDFADEANQAIFRQQLARVGDTRHRFYEIELRRRDGRNVPLFFQATTHFDPTGRHLLSFAFITDLTERKALEQALAENEQRWLMALEATGLGVWDWNVVAGTVFYSGRWKAMLGYVEEEVANDPSAWSDRVHPEDFPHCRDALARHCSGQTDFYRCEYRIRHKNGSWRWVLDQGTAFERDPAGLPVRVVGTLTDVTERKQLEQSLAAYQSHLEELVAERTASLARAEAIAHVGSWHLDIRNNRLTWSDEAYRIFGVPPGEALTFESFAATIHPADSARVHAAWRSALKGRPYDVEHRIIADGRVKWLRERAELVYDADGSTVAAHGAVQDITELKAAAEATSAALAAAQRLAQVKSEFLANMSHEIRTPLNAVLGLARIGARDTGDPPTRDTFARILDAGEHLLGVINDVLDISKIDAHKLRIEPRPFVLADTVAKARGFVARAAQEKALAYTAEPAPDLPTWVSGDAQRVQQILVNLLSNAVKFTDRGEVRLRVAREGDQTYFKVIDTGIGMTGEQLAHLFTPFEQGDSSVTRRHGGTGLGLAISQKLAGLMGGEITVESAPGAGTSFTLRLPLPVAAPLPAETAVPAQAGSRLRGLRVLAAEDIEVNRLILGDLLIQEGAEVEFAENGCQLLERLRHAGPTAFDVVLMDVQMPEMDGYEATRQLRVRAPGLPVIGLTAHALAEERDRCLAAGMCEHVTKPIDTDRLVATILRHATAARGEVADDAGAAPAAPSGELADAASDRTSGSASAATSAPAMGVIDWPALLGRFGGRATFVNKLAGTALASHGDTPARLRSAAQARDKQTLLFVAHTLKGVAGNLSATPLGELAARTEAAIRAGEAAAEALVPELAAATEGLLQALRQHLDAQGAAGDARASSGGRDRASA